MNGRFRKRVSSGTRWSAHEDRIVKTLYPDYPEILRRLRTRSYYAIRSRARTLGVAAPRHIWTNRDVAKLRALYLQGATRAEVAAAFPRLSQSQVCSKAGHISLVRARRAPYTLGIPPIDTIREQAAVQRWTWRKLDTLAKTRRYFQQTTRRVDWKHLANAVEKLGGTIEIAWLPDDAASGRHR
ncbi:MAG TPA: hypothetical protein VGC39_03935 [Candidatus Methylacidiphilales bacterium]